MAVPFRVAILGCGKMGTAMAERLLEQGHGLVLWNRTPKRAFDAAENVLNTVQKGRVIVAQTPRHAVAALSGPPAEAEGATAAEYDEPRRLLIMTVANGEAAESVVNALELRRLDPRGVTIANLVSGSPDEGRRVADLIAAATAQTKTSPGQGVEYVDGAFCGAPAAARAGTGQLFVSATSPRAVDDVRPILSALGDVVFSGTQIGASRALDYAVVDLAFVNLMSFVSNAAMLEKEGVEWDVFVREASKRLAVVPDALHNAAERMRRGVPYDENPVATLATWRNFWASRRPYLKAAGLPDHVVADLAVSLLDRAGASTPRLRGSDVTRLQEVLRFGKDIDAAQEAAASQEEEEEGKPAEPQGSSSSTTM